MININNLGDICPILISKKGNPEIVKIVKKYFDEHDPVYYQFVKWHWYDKRQAKCHFNVTAKEYEDIKYKIVVDIMNLVQDYYIARKKKYDGIKKISDLVTYKKKSSTKLKK